MRHDMSEQYGRKCKARICNYSFNENENTINIVCSVAKDVDGAIQVDEIGVSHLTGKIKHDKPRENILNNSAGKLKSMKFRKILREKKSNTFIYEDAGRSTFHVQAVEKYSKSDVEKAWIFNGIVFIKVKGTEDPLEIQSIADLGQITPNRVQYCNRTALRLSFRMYSVPWMMQKSSLFFVNVFQ